MHWLLSTNDKVTAFFYFPALARFKFLFWSAIDANKSSAINYFHDFFSAQVKA